VLENLRLREENFRLKVAAHLTLETATDLWTPHPSAAALAFKTTAKKRSPRPQAVDTHSSDAPSRREVTVTLDLPRATAATNARVNSPGVQF